MHTEVYGYSDPDYRGVLRVKRETINAIAVLCDKLGWQMTAHTTGGASTDALLDAYEAVDKIASIKDRRFTPPTPTFPTPKPSRAPPNSASSWTCNRPGTTTTVRTVEGVLGPERMKWFQPYKSVFDAGVVRRGRFRPHDQSSIRARAINPYNPFFGMWMVVMQDHGRKSSIPSKNSPASRRSRCGPERRLTSFDEDVKGSLEAGKYADMVILDRDILTLPRGRHPMDRARANHPGRQGDLRLRRRTRTR
ncbi:MAG: amidohydrolase family protein [Bryobacterales bacterium]